MSRQTGRVNDGELPPDQTTARGREARMQSKETVEVDRRAFGAVCGVAESRSSGECGNNFLRRREPRCSIHAVGATLKQHNEFLLVRHRRGGYRTLQERGRSCSFRPWPRRRIFMKIRRETFIVVLLQQNHQPVQRENRRVRVAQPLLAVGVGFADRASADRPTTIAKTTQPRVAVPPTAAETPANPEPVRRSSPRSPA